MWFRRKAPQKPSRLRSIDVVNAYGAILDSEPEGFGGSMREDVLPFDKAIIKASLIDVVNQQDISDSILNILGNGYIFLAKFRPDGGGKSIFSDVGDLENRENLYRLASELAETSEAEQAMRSSISAEMKDLLQEWNSRPRGSFNA